MSVKPSEDEYIDPATGEVMKRRAADGGLLPPAARTTADVIRMAEGGQFDADVCDELQKLLEAIEERHEETGLKTEGSLTLTLNFRREPDGMFFIEGAYKTKLPPPLPRKRTIAWLTEDGYLTPTPPRQGVLFAPVREVSGSNKIRN
jgi:hypothetical protein